jgi:hypothetical protein
MIGWARYRVSYRLGYLIDGPRVDMLAFSLAPHSWVRWISLPSRIFSLYRATYNNNNNNNCPT